MMSGPLPPALHTFRKFRYSELKPYPNKYRELCTLDSTEVLCEIGKEQRMKNFNLIAALGLAIVSGLCVSASAEIKVDCDFPGGNIIVVGIAGDIRF